MWPFSVTRNDEWQVQELIADASGGMAWPPPGSATARNDGYEYDKQYAG